MVALPGYPYAALVGVLTMLGPLLAGMAGRALPDLPTARLVGGAPSMGEPPAPPRPARAGADPDPAGAPPPRRVGRVGRARPTRLLWGAALADAFAVVPPGWRDDPVALLDPPR